MLLCLNGQYMEPDTDMDGADPAETMAWEEQEAALEREAEWIAESEADYEEHCKEEPLSDTEPETGFSRRRMERLSLERLERSARTQEEFAALVRIWDRLDANRERRERYHEVGRSEVPLEYGMAEDGILFPLPSSGFGRFFRKGEFLDAIFDCPFELHEQTADADLSNILSCLKDDQKEVLYYLSIRLYSTKLVGRIRGQTDRNIRKLRCRILEQIRKKLLPVLRQRKERGLPLTKAEKDFLQDEETKRRKATASTKKKP